MGRFTYDGGPRAEIEDRALTHLQLVMTAKLRRGESFPFTWREDVGLGGGRTTVWITPSSSLVFTFFGSRPPNLNRHWMQDLAATAGQLGGLYLTPEPLGGDPTWGNEDHPLLV